jgi:hypothetical protein
VSDSKEFDRRQLLGIGAAGAIGGVAGFLLGRQSGPPAPPATPETTPSPSAQPASAPGITGRLPPYEWRLTVQGGYGWWFKKNGNKTNVLLMALDKAKCTCGGQECIQHDMTLIAFKTAVEVDAGTTYNPVESGNMLTWPLLGATKFIQGMPGNGITEGNTTKWDDIADPFGPYDPNEPTLWNDQVWLPARQKAKRDAESFSSAAFLLTDGTLAVGHPWHDQARGGRFVFQVNGSPKKKALTDRLVLSGRTADPIGIETAGGKIFLKPKTDTMALSIRHEVHLQHVPLTPGMALPHFTRLFDFVDGSTCTSAAAPTYEKRTDLDGFDTPGDLCPPIPLD